MKINSQAIRDYRQYVSEELTSWAIEEIEAETIREAEKIAKEREIEDRLWDYLHELRERIEAGETDLWDEYSDVYKDLNGIRPRW